MRVRVRSWWIAMGGVYAILVVALLGAGPAQAPPPLPNVFSGDIFLNGEPAPAGLQLLGCVRGCNLHEGLPTTTKSGGRYDNLVIQPPNTTFGGKEITFFVVTEAGRLQAQEISIFSLSAFDINRSLDLSFFGVLPTPTPTPTPTPEPTPTPTATPVVTTTPALPIPGDPLVPQLAKGVLYGGIAVLVVGALGLFWARRRHS